MTVLRCIGGPLDGEDRETDHYNRLLYQEQMRISPYNALSANELVSMTPTHVYYLEKLRAPGFETNFWRYEHLTLPEALTELLSGYKKAAQKPAKAN